MTEIHILESIEGGAIALFVYFVVVEIKKWILKLHSSIIKNQIKIMLDLTKLTADFGVIKTGLTNLVTSYQSTLTQLKQIQSELADDTEAQAKIDALHQQATDDINQITAALTPVADTPPAQG